eukprot:scaffold272960_cov37-Tisochrysis_lutea.AAC.1
MQRNRAVLILTVRHRLAAASCADRRLHDGENELDDESCVLAVTSVILCAVESIIVESIIVERGLRTLFTDEAPK